MFGLQATACGRELMFGLFEMKYMNICLVAGVILELIALVAILNLYINIRRRERRQDRKSTRLNSSHNRESRMPSSA